MGKLAQRLADASRSGVYRIRSTEAIEEAAAINGYSVLRLNAALPKRLPHVVLLEMEDRMLLEQLKEHAEKARRRGECFFAALIDASGNAALPPLYDEKI